MQFQCTPISSAGTYSTAATIGFGIGKNAWFCNQGCTVMDNEYNTSLRWFDNGFEDDEPFYSLSIELYNLLKQSDLGIYDGHEIAMDNKDGSYYTYGPNAETLFKKELPILKKYDFLICARAVLQFGDGNDGQRIDVEV